MNGMEYMIWSRKSVGVDWYFWHAVFWMNLNPRSCCHSIWLGVIHWHYRNYSELCRISGSFFSRGVGRNRPIFIQWEKRTKLSKQRIVADAPTLEWSTHSKKICSVENQCFCNRPIWFVSTPFHHQLTKSYSNDIPISDVFEVFPLYTCYFLSVYLLVSCQYAWAATKMSDSTAGAATLPQERDIRDCMYMIFIVAVCMLLEYSFHGQTEKRAEKRSVCVLWDPKWTETARTRNTNISDTQS